MKSSSAAFTPNDIRNVRDTEAARNNARPGRRPPSPKLTALAEAMGGLSARPPYSPIVLTRLVRLAEFLLLCATGFLVHWLYVVPQVGFSFAYVVLILAISSIAVVGFNAFAGYTIGSFRTPIKQGVKLAASSLSDFPWNPL